MTTYTIANIAPITGTVSIGGAVPPSNLTYGSYNYTSVSPIISAASSSGMLTVSGDAEISGNLTIQGVNVTSILQQIQDRLCILVPDPKRLAKYEALKQAYEHYKLLEALCVDVDTEKK